MNFYSLEIAIYANSRLISVITSFIAYNNWRNHDFRESVAAALFSLIYQNTYFNVISIEIGFRKVV